MSKQTRKQQKQDGGKKQQKQQQGGKKEQKQQQGGKRKTRKMAKGPSDWNKKVMEIYRDMKKKDPSVKLGAAMKEASRRKKRGDL
jgi:hypothetical protein